MATGPHVAVGSGGLPPPAFAARHPADTWFFATLIAVLWLLALGGFVPEMVERLRGEPPPYPLVIHVHAVVFFGWLTFLALQMTLVRTGNVRVHRSLGAVGALLAVSMVALGPWAAFTMQLAHQAPQPPKFLAIQLLNILVFGVLVAAGLALRRDAAAHKRLMLVATMSIIGAGFGRIVTQLTGAPPPFTIVPGVYIAANVLLLAIAIHDHRTRGRQHPAFLIAAGVFIATEFAAGQLLRSPGWTEFTRALVS